MQTKLSMCIALFQLISNCSHLKSSLIYYIFPERRLLPRVHTTYSSTKIIMQETWAYILNWFIFYFQRELIQGQTKVWKRNFSFWRELSWLHHFSSVDIKFLSHEHPSLSPPLPTHPNPTPAVINAATSEAMVWGRPLHRWGGTAGHVERKATEKFAPRTRVQESVSGQTDGGRREKEI